MSIAIIAIGVTLVSLASVFYQASSFDVAHLSKHLTTRYSNDKMTTVMASAQTLTRQQVHERVFDVAPPPATRPPSTSAFKANPNSLSMVHVVPYGKGVTKANIHHVKNTLLKADSLGLISQTLRLNLKQPMTILVVNQTSSYVAALKHLGVRQSVAEGLAQSTGGFAANSSIILPLNENTGENQLANTLTHEMTHVFLNQDIGPMPSWTNEGIAVFMGMKGQKAVESETGFEGDERQLAENILDVASSGQLVALTGNENAILSGQENYDYELQDWLAISDLVSQHAISSIQRYLSLMREGAGEKQSFIVAFGEQEDVFNKNFTHLLKTAAQERNGGASLELTVKPDYHGNIEFLGAGRKAWHGVVAKSGRFQIDVNANGTITSELKSVAPKADKKSPDDNTVYVSLLPTSTEKWKGKIVKGCGFAFDLSNGLYAFENGWVSLADGNTEYRSTPTLFGVTIDSVQELNQSNPLIPVLNAV